MDVIIYGILLAILVALGVGLVRLLTHKDPVKALTVRIVVSIALFLGLILAAWLGWIKPHGVRPEITTSTQK